MRFIRNPFLILALSAAIFATSPAAGQTPVPPAIAVPTPADPSSIPATAATSPFLPATVVNPYTGQTVAVTVTSDAIWKSYPLAVQQLRGAMTFDQAQLLAKAGVCIDNSIMLWNWDAALTMFMRYQYGYTWVPCANQPNVTLAPFLSVPGVAPYDPLHPPAGSITVSVSAASFQPSVQPVVVPAPVVATNLVGNPAGDGFTFYPGPGAMINSLTPAVTNGQVVTQNGVRYQAHVVRGLFGLGVSFTLVP
jgi:hypothetical protein